jgi:hypothetical protein
LLGLIAPLLALVAVVTTSLGVVLAVSTHFEAAWIGPPIRRWSLLGIPVAAVGIGVLALLLPTRQSKPSAVLTAAITGAPPAGPKGERRSCASAVRPAAEASIRIAGRTIA